MSSSRRSLRLRKISPGSINDPADPMAKLPDLCIDVIFSYLSPTELIGIQRVNKTWRDSVNWRFSRAAYWKQWSPPLGADDTKVEYDTWEEAAVAFRRAVYRYEMRKRGEPTFIRKFTSADQGWAVCGDYFVWIDANFINAQLIFDAKNPGRMVQPIQRFPLQRLSNWDQYNAVTHVRMLGVQETGGVGEQPLLALIFLNRTGASRYPISRVVVMDVVRGKLLWCIEDPKGSVFHCTLNRSVLSYIQYANPQFDVTSGERCPPSLVVLDILTGALKSSTKLHLGHESGREIREIRAHPRRELIFVLLCNEIMVFSTITMDWVGALKLLVVSTSSNHHLGHSPYALSGGAWELQFDEYEPKGGARDKVSACGLRCELHGPEPLKRNYFVVQSFELPTTEELKALSKSDEESVDVGPETSHKPITSWKRQPIEILDARDVMTHFMNHPEINIKAKQIAVMLPSPNFKSNRAIIYTYKEETQVPEMFVISVAAGEGSSVRGKGKEKEKSEVAGVEIKWFTPSAKSEVTKMRKNLPRDTPYTNRRMPASFSGLRGYKGPQLKERYMVFDQRTDVFLSSFSPPW